jgi:hypothetical protein
VSGLPVPDTEHGSSSAEDGHVIAAHRGPLVNRPSASRIDRSDSAAGCWSVIRFLTPAPQRLQGVAAVASGDPSAPSVLQAACPVRAPPTLLPV